MIILIATVSGVVVSVVFMNDLSLLIGGGWPLHIGGVDALTSNCSCNSRPVIGDDVI